MKNKFIYIEDNEERDDLIDSLFSDDETIENNSSNETGILDSFQKIEDYNKCEDIAVRNALNLAQEMKSLIEHIPYAKETLRTELSVLDKAQEDLLSKIENDKFNVVDGYRLIKQVKEIRIKRRTVKNNLFVYETLGAVEIPKEEIINDVVIKAKNIEGDVKYKPRVLKDINYKFNDNKNSKFKDIKKEELLSLE